MKPARLTVSFTSAAVGQADRDVDGGQRPGLSGKIARFEDLRDE
jgi:hypothetical protein